MLKPEIIDQAKRNDNLISDLSKANATRLISVINWFKPPYSNKLMLHKNLVIIAKYCELPIEDLMQPELDPAI